MSRAIRLLLLQSIFTGYVCAQTPEDTVRVLHEVTVKAYASERPLLETPVAIGLIKAENLNRFSNTSFVSTFNTLPGVRMEERSPGSYRFSIRGSSLRSPFGVRNVKFYWNGLPLTDGGGNTYVNLIDFSALGSAEVIKGPAGSLYGAGTGGVVLMNPPAIRQNQVTLSAMGGSFGLQRYNILAQTKTEDVLSSVRYGHQQADGYRTQSAMSRDAFNTDMSFLFNPANTLSTNIFYSNLYYQTPGGLTQPQFDGDPKQARPGTTVIPGAVEQQAAVYNKTLYGGVNFDHEWNSHWNSRLGVMGSTIDFRNAAILNYETRSEHNIGIRSENQYEFDPGSWTGKITFGGEFQYFTSHIRVTDNNLGVQGNSVMSDDDVQSTLGLAFVQAEFDLPGNFYFTVGGSLNFVQYNDINLLSSPEQKQARKFDPVLSPRIAVLKKFSKDFSAYLSASKGFSPPTIAEVIPSSGVYNTGLNPEEGWSFETGVKGTFLEALQFSLAVYDFELQEAIVIQPQNGVDYFVNAGATSQLGTELSLNWSKRLTGPVSLFNLWSSYTYNRYRFLNFVSRGNNYSGNAMTGVPPTVLIFGADIQFKGGVYINLTTNFTDKLPLNDANTVYATDYFLVGMRAGYKLRSKFPIEFFVGADNLLDQRYSLGNDLNAAAGRYYNAAATRNYYAGVSVSFIGSD